MYVCTTFVVNKRIHINLDRSFYRFVTMHGCDGRTDRRTEFSSLYRVCITCSAVKTAYGTQTYTYSSCL